MVEKIQNLLEKQGYLPIESNVPFVKLYVRYEMSYAKVIQLLDCTEEVPLTVEQYTVFCDKSKEHILKFIIISEIIMNQLIFSLLS